MKKLAFLLLLSTFSFAQTKAEKGINTVLNQWHAAASKANFSSYFDLMTSDAVFIGTDATEVWNKTEFMAYAKPHFDKGKAWSFTSLNRTIYFSKNKKTAWFDELLDTQMELCRGSGTLVKTKNGWKIAHYVLSMTVPNEVAREVIKTKKPLESKNSFREK